MAANVRGMHHHQPGYYSYLVERDLNPTGGPVTDGRDPRALFYFFGPTLHQRVENLSTGRLLISYEPAYATGYGAPREPRVNAVLEPGAQPLELHAGAFHLLAWFDPALPPTSGVPAKVRVSAL